MHFPNEMHLSCSAQSRARSESRSQAWNGLVLPMLRTKEIATVEKGCDAICPEHCGRDKIVERARTKASD